MNHYLNTQLALIVDRDVPVIVMLTQPVGTRFTINLGPGQDQAAARRLHDRLASID